MPYDLKTKSGLILRNIPDDVSPDAPELRALAQKHEMAQVKPTTREERIAALKTQNPGEYDPESPEWKAKFGATSGMSGYEKVMSNIGAGMANLGQGVRQLGAKVGLGGGVSDDDIDEKRRADKQLAADTTGGTALQIAGEALPTLVIPAGTFAKGAQLGARGVGALSRTLGRQGAEKAAQATANALGQGTTRLAVDSALSGAASGALGPVKSDESRLANAGVGAAFGTAVPFVGRALGSGYRALTKTGAAQRAARMAQEAAGDDPAVLRRLSQYTKDAPDIPLTSAAAAQSEGLAALEQGARARRGADFSEGDLERARAVYEKVIGSTAEADQLAARKGARAAEWKSNWGVAEDVADPAVFAARIEQLKGNLAQAARSSESSNPEVLGVINGIQKELERLGDDFAPGNLQQIRAGLNGRSNPMSANAYKAAPRDSAAVGSLTSELDDILNATTNGAWDAVKGGYATASRGVEASKAAGQVRESFVDPLTGSIRKTAADAAGDVPQITEAGLRGAIDKARLPDKSTALSADAAQGLDRTLTALRKQGIVQRVKKSATAGGGSDTVSNAVASGLADRLPGKVGAAIDFATDFANRKRDQALIDALRDPAEMTRLLQLAARAPGELSTRERALLKILRGGAATGAVSELRPD